MIKIELVKFEAQDVITVSSVPATQLQPAQKVYAQGCICDTKPAFIEHTVTNHGPCTAGAGWHLCEVPGID